MRRGFPFAVSDSTARLQNSILARMYADDHGMPRIERKEEFYQSERLRERLLSPNYLLALYPRNPYSKKKR